VTFRVEEGIAYLAIMPPAADLALAVSELSSALEQLQAQSQVTAVVFERGLELLAAGPPLASAPLDGLLDQISCCDVPVLAVLGGTVTGTGLAIALTCHAQPDARLGFPEVRLGLMPPPATILRFTRLAGAAGALAAMTAGAVIDAHQGVTLGLIDQVSEDPARVPHARVFSRAAPTPPWRVLISSPSFAGRLQARCAGNWLHSGLSMAWRRCARSPRARR
jgi:3-hydroxyacyl-CoA dehydrogenase